MIRFLFLFSLCVVVSCTTAPDLKEELRALALQLQDDADHTLLSTLHPIESDYEVIFRQGLSREQGQAYSEEQWAEIYTLPANIMTPLTEDATLQILAVFSTALRTGRSNEFPEEYYRVAIHLKDEITLYAIQYLNPDGTEQLFRGAFFHIDDRWIYIPQPYMAYKSGRKDRQ